MIGAGLKIAGKLPFAEKVEHICRQDLTLTESEALRRRDPVEHPLSAWEYEQLSKPKKYPETLT
jgi:hypothetical protein